MVILGFLRSIVTAAFLSVPNEEHLTVRNGNGESTNSSTVVEDNESNNALEEMLVAMECRFVIGALIGVCTAWSITDVILGMTAQMVTCLVALIFALAWVKLVLSCYNKSTRKIDVPIGS